MGTDLDTGVLVFSEAAVETSGPLGSETDPRHIVTIKAKQRGAADGGEESLTFEMNREQFARLGETFARYAGHDGA